MESVIKQNKMTLVFQGTNPGHIWQATSVVLFVFSQRSNAKSPS